MYLYGGQENHVLLALSTKITVEHKFQEVKDCITKNFELEAQIENLLRQNHDELLARFNNVDEQLLRIMYSITEFRDIIQQIAPQVILTKQEENILNQFVNSGSNYLIDYFNLSTPINWKAGDIKIQVENTRTLNSSLERLASLGFLLPKKNSQGGVNYGLTEQAFDYVKNLENLPGSIGGVKNKIFNSIPDNWIYDDNSGIYTLKEDVQIQIRQNRSEESGDFSEEWVKSFPDNSAYWDKHSLYYNNNKIGEYNFIAVDGYRMSIPLPKSTRELSITREMYSLGKIINMKHRGYDFDDYLSKAGITIV